MKELLLEAAEALEECAEGFQHPMEVAARLRAAAASETRRTVSCPQCSWEFAVDVYPPQGCRQGDEK